MKPYSCTCGNTLYFDNSQCLECKREVGYDPAVDKMVEVGPKAEFRRCANGVTHNACNWVVPAADDGNLCTACVLSRRIPDLSIAENVRLWAIMEQAKRQAIYCLIRLGLPIVNRIKDPVSGLAFEFLRPLPNKPVLTGQDKGVITMNLEEADDAIRERNRTSLHEPYRTLVGHFRHELGHYYWYRWFEVDAPSSPLLNTYREVFGDERQDYGAAMKIHYEKGAPAGWENSFISAYSTMHSWEDWAETWAHYLHIVDGLETAKAFGLEQGVKRVAINSFEPDAARLPAPLEGRDPAPCLAMLHRWVRLSPALNAISRSLGQRYLYPFILSIPVAKKLHLVDALIQDPPAPEAPSETAETPPQKTSGGRVNDWLKNLFVWGGSER